MNSIINTSGHSKSNNSNNDTRSIQSRGGADDLETFVMGNCLMLQAAAAAADSVSAAVRSGESDDVGRMFTCKTCGRKFNSFQALGGHRASHRKAKPDGVVDGELTAGEVKVKSHACSICGVEFPIGQALGGHMRRHRPLIVTRDGNGSTVTSEGSGGNSDGSNKIKTEERKRKNGGYDSDEVLGEEVEKVVKKVKKEEVWLELGLNLDAWAENINKNNNKKDEKEKEKEKVEIEEGETVEEVLRLKQVVEVEDEEEEIEDFLKLELRTPSVRYYEV